MSIKVFSRNFVSNLLNQIKYLKRDARLVFALRATKSNFHPENVTANCFFKNCRKVTLTKNRHFIVDTKNDIPVVQYEEIKKLPEHPEKLLIDVREPYELQETGQIPTSINIPLEHVSNELSISADPKKFNNKYHREKPNKSTYIIFQCLKGMRSEAAAKIAIGMGYVNVKNYKGSWQDWAEREGLSPHK